MKTDDQPKSSNFADLLKFIMSIFVVAIHAHFLKGNEIADMLISDVFGRIAVPFFFTAAAFFLFRHIDEPTIGLGKISKRFSLRKRLSEPRER